MDIEKQVAVKFLNKTVEQTTGRRAKPGLLFGVELEIEGRGVEMEGIPSKNWKRVAEGSLRGESIEYVFADPCEYDEAKNRVNKLFQMFKKHDVKLNNSYRTSTHVHLNFGDKTNKQVLSFFFAHTVLEELFEHYCGDSRKGNLFCLSTRDTEGLVDMIERAVFQNGNWCDFGENIRYNAANLAALNQFGSIEIRTMRGADSAADVLDWLDIMNQLYKYAVNDCPNPVRMVENLSYLGAEGFLRQFFDEPTIARLLKAWPPIKDFNRSLMDGVRLVQMLAYRMEEAWSAEAPKIDKGYILDDMPAMKDPFGRPVREGNRQMHDKVILPGGAGWHVIRQDQVHDGARDATPKGTIVYDGNRGCWLLIDGMKPLRWKVKNGKNLLLGGGLEREVNRLWYRAAAELDEDDDDDDDDEWGGHPNDDDDDEE